MTSGETHSATKPWIYDCDFETLARELAKLGMPAYAARQVFRWLYVRKEPDPHQWSDISLVHRRNLADTFDTKLPPVLKESTDEGGTRKVLLELGDGERIEAVFIPEQSHVTFCISSQVGCPLGCAFCATGKMGLRRNLTPGEIISQVLLLNRMMAEPEARFNIVFMGMGEPLLNLDNVLAALDVLTGKEAMGIPQRHITLSTVGFPEALRRLESRFPGIKLSVSIHAADDATRNRLMPATARQSLIELVRYFSSPRRHPVTFEYVLIRGVNDSFAHARRLARLVSGIHCKVNLIPVNPVKDSGFLPPSESEEERFLAALTRSGIPVTVRRSKGGSIRSACGQLATETMSDSG